jgi:Kef-type K+ transport system membrane component KefB
MINYIDLFIFFGGFFMIAIASWQIAKYFPKIKLPLITGFLFIGLISGPFILNLVPHEAVDKLSPIFDFSLAFIAFAAGSELYLKEIRGRFKSIFWMTFGQLVITFFFGSFAVFYLSGFIPFMKDLDFVSRVSIALLMGTIFVARSPASAIAVINELRAAGPYTKTAIGVTVVKDVLVIILFACCFAVAKAFSNGVDLDYYFLIILVLELIGSFGLGYVLAKILEGFLAFGRYYWLKTGLILATGFGVFIFAHSLQTYSKANWGVDFYLEPLLICIIGSFILTNFSNYRLEFLKIIHEAGTPIYVLFFTLTGATLSLDVLAKVWSIALILFGVRLITIIFGSLIGGRLGGDSWKRRALICTVL